MVTLMMLAVAVATQDPRGTHVRTVQREIAAFIEAGRARSATFRRLIATLDGSDVIVHVEPKLTRPGLGGFLNYKVVAVGGYRYLRIAIDVRGPNSHVVPLLAHELQHAIEIADAPEARDAKGVEDVFRRLNGITGHFASPYSLETDAAINIEQAVRSELMASPEHATSNGRSAVTAPDPSAHHVRMADPKLVTLFQAGLSRSETFRRLVDALDASDVIVYVDPKTTRRALGGYLAHNVVAAGTYRYVHIAVEVQGAPGRLVPLLAHELQHANEVAQDSTIRDEQGIVTLFERRAIKLGCGSTTCSETQAAINVEAAVGAEWKAAH